MNLAVVGSRTFTNYELLKIEISNLLKEYSIKTIISGGASGADTLAERYAKEMGLHLKIIKPEWSKYGKKAGYIRNVEIWNNSDLGIAFWDGQSTGTAHSFEIAKKQNKTIKIVNYSPVI